MKTANRRSTVLALLCVLVPLSASLCAAAEPLRLALDGPGWELSGDDAVVEPFDGRLALRLKSGKATYRDLEFLDGTIEFDLQVTKHRSFAYIYFRMEGDDEHEGFYFRAHKTLLPDAVQYAPVYKGRSQWQLFHDARATAAAPLPAGEWIPVKVVVKGSQAAVFVGSTEEPQLVVPRLARDSKPGFLALRSFMTVGTPPDTYVANFANVVVRPGVVDYAFPAYEATAPKPGLITRWQVSPAFAPAEGLVLEIPSEISTSSRWQTVAANADGFVELERYVERPENIRRAAVVARLRITAKEPETVRLNLGFSDEVSVFLNGRLLVADDESYSFTSPRRQGLLTDDQLSVFLPLEKGANDLHLAVTDSFGGWGLSGRLEASAGVTVDADPELQIAGSTALAQATTDWPVWSGPEGNLTSLGNGIFDGGAFGLERVWSRPLGSAYSGIVVAGGRLTTTFSDGESDYLVALDAATGAEQWRYRISDTYKGHDGSDDGPLATPTLDGRAVYGLGARGELFAVSLEDGSERWRRDLVADVGAVKPYYGFTSAPLVIGDLLVVETGAGDGHSISAFDRETGELRWSAGDDSVRYQSPMAFDMGGETSLVAVTDRSLLGLAPETGEVLWQHRHTEGDARGFGSAQPVPVGESGILLIDGRESALFEVTKNAEGYMVKEAWRSRALRSQGNFATAVPHAGYLYGYSGSFLTCVDAATGETVWKSRPPGVGNLVLIDGHLVILIRSGEIVVAEATPDEYREVARVQALERGYFTRPSFAGGKVYVRNLTDIAAIGVTEASSAESAGTERADWDLRGDFGAFVEKLALAELAEMPENKSEMIESFLAEHPTLPILEGNLVHFVFHGEVDDLAVSGNFIRDGAEHAMHRLDGTNFYFRTYELPKKAVFTYRFLVFDEAMTDPANPHKTGPEGDEHSVLATAGWQAPSHLREPEGERGTLETLAWKSELLDNEREVQIYLPPGYGEGDDRYPLLVVVDGEQALSIGEMDKSLDNLIGKTVAPVIVAFVPTVQYGELDGTLAKYARAHVEELIPLLDKTFRTDARRESRAVLGQDPYGGAGFAAMYFALLHPETFSRAAAQSYRHGELEQDLMAAASGEKHDLELVFHWSSYDTFDPFFDFDARRDAKSLVAALETNGYSPKVFESNDGVGWGMWQGRMAEILEALFPLE